ncbi:MAG: DUF4091 domain-containing protein [Clostridia bacterium]|nr:DUF4091 domain-containing protein [Clostridia bacterium]
MVNAQIVDSMTEVLISGKFPEKNLSSITVCRNQTANFQLAFGITDGSEKSKNFYVRVETSLPLSLYYVNNVPVIHTSSADTNVSPGLYPDMLLEKSINPPLSDNSAPPFGKFMAEDNEKVLLRAYDDSPQALWFCINEHEKTLKPGNYPIDIRIFDRAETLQCTAHLDVCVLDKKLPAQKITYTNWFHHDCLCDTYGVEVFSDRYFEIMADYVEKAARNGMNMILLPAFTPPLDTGIGRERMTVQLVKVTKNGKEYSFDFSLMKKFIDICRKCGIKKFEHCHLFTQWGAKSAPKIMVHENGKYKNAFGWKAKASGKAYVSFLNQYLPALKEFLIKEKLEKSIMFHISDEPDSTMLEDYAKARGAVQKHLDGFTVGDAMSHVEYYERGFCKTPISDIPTVHDFIGKCPGLWAYYTGGSSMNGRSSRVLTVPRYRNRMLGIQMWYYGISGFLHWGYNNYYGEQSKYLFNPATNTNGGFSLPGTSYIVYPAFDGTCIQSVRQKIFAEGLCDIRLLTLAEKLCGRDACEKLIEKHFSVPHFDKTPENADTFRAFTKEIYEMIKKVE